VDAESTDDDDIFDSGAYPVVGRAVDEEPCPTDRVGFSCKLEQNVIDLEALLDGEGQAALLTVAVGGFGGRGGW
jgi:hypothetical protein